ncbi:MAG: hypothetical protein ACRDBG_17635 [Waterburya sp.]
MTSLKLRQNRWQLEQVLPKNSRISPQVWSQIPLEVSENFFHLLSRDVFSEADAQILYDYLLTRQNEMSGDFWAMLQLWLEDELKHYQALRRVYHCLFGVSYSSMDQVFKQRNPNFEAIKLVLADEFTILVTLMFDEIGSVYSYRRDLWEYYRHFGGKVAKIAHYLVQDEGKHFSNAAEILLSHHRDRLPEVREFLLKIVDLENRLGRYYQSFLLDHAQEQKRFPPNFNQLIVQVVLARLGLAKLPPPRELNQLWQWTPPGHNLTPVFISLASS